MLSAPSVHPIGWRCIVRGHKRARWKQRAKLDRYRTGTVATCRLQELHDGQWLGVDLGSSQLVAESMWLASWPAICVTRSTGATTLVSAGIPFARYWPNEFIAPESGTTAVWRTQRLAQPMNVRYLRLQFDTSRRSAMALAVFGCGCSRDDPEQNRVWLGSTTDKVGYLRKQPHYLPDIADCECRPSSLHSAAWRPETGIIALSSSRRTQLRDERFRWDSVCRYIKHAAEELTLLAGLNQRATWQVGPGMHALRPSLISRLRCRSASRLVDSQSTLLIQLSE